MERHHPEASPRLIESFAFTLAREILTEAVMTRVSKVSLLIAVIFCGCLYCNVLTAQQKSAAGQKSEPTVRNPADAKSAAGSDKGSSHILNAAGWPIHITYFPATAGKESPTVILLTSTDGPDKADARNRQVWEPTALMLQKAGFAVVTADLRKHGASVPTSSSDAKETSVKAAADDYTLMVAADMEVIKQFIMQEHTAEKLNAGKLGIVSMGSSAMVAAAFTIADWDKKPFPDGPTPALSTPRGQDVRALIAYSPSTTVKGINSTTILKALKALPVAVHIVSSKDNKDDLRSADKYFKAVDPKDEAYAEFRKITLVPGEIRAERFLDARYAEVTNKDIVEFLSRNLKDLEKPWVSRKDRRTN